METFNHPIRKLLPEFPRAEAVARDHTATIAFKQCPRRYFYRMVLGYTEAKTPRYFVFGSAYHKFREIFDKTKDEDKALEAMKKVWAKEGGEAPIAPNDKFAFMTIDRLLISVIHAVKKQQKDNEHGRIEILAVEQDFAIEVINPDNLNEKMIISGKADRIDKINGRVWGRDHKTSSLNPSYYAMSLAPNDQVTRYTFAENVLNGWDYLDPMAASAPPVMGQIYEVLFNTKTTGPEIRQFTTTRTPQQLMQWLRDQFGTERMITMCRETDTWPMFEANCKYCPYRDVCDSPNEGSMAAKLKAHFKYEPWDSQNRSSDSD